MDDATTYSVGGGGGIRVRSSLKLSQGGLRCCLAAVITDVGRSAASAPTAAAAAAEESLSCIVFGMCRMSTTAHYLYWTPLWSL